MIEFELDEDNYPTDKTLETIKKWEGSFNELLENIRQTFPYFGSCEETSPGVYSIATGGWSGCESIIGALKENKLFWLNHWEQSTRGGLYIFDLN